MYFAADQLMAETLPCCGPVTTTDDVGNMYDVTPFLTRGSRCKECPAKKPAGNVVPADTAPLTTEAAPEAPSWLLGAGLAVAIFLVLR